MCGLVVVCNPGLLVGALAWWLVWAVYGLSRVGRWLVAAVIAFPAVLASGHVVIGWPWRLGALHWAVLQRMGIRPEHSLENVITSVCIEVFAGPVLGEIAGTAVAGLLRTMPGRLWSQRRAMRKWMRAMTGARLPTPTSAPTRSDTIVLGVDRSTHQWFELERDELDQHAFIPGATGTGKTTTLVRLAAEAVRNGFGVVIIDCKGAGLKESARRLARQAHLPFHLVDPDDPDSLGYDPCTGDGTDVSNRLVGSFTFGQNAEIYKLAAQNILPVLVDALRAAGKTVTLSALEEHLDEGPMSRLAHDSEPHYKRTLLRLSHPDGAAKDGYNGFQLRLGALIRGKFGRLLNAQDNRSAVLDWTAATQTPAVTYLPLRATASSEDVELMGRVIAQDLKQLIGQRLQQGDPLTPVLVIVDEFAALREAEQFVDALLQARQARMSFVLSTQYIPETESIRKAALSAGLLIAHRLESADAKDVSEQFGTKPHWEDVVQIGPEGPTGLSSVRLVDVFRVHPNALRDMQRGFAAIRSVRRQRRAIVQIERANL